MTQQRDVVMVMRQQCLHDAATFRSPLCVDQTPETVTQCGNRELQYSLSLPYSREIQRIEIQYQCIDTAESREMQCVDYQRADMQKTSVGYGLVSLGWMLCEEKDALK